MVETFEVKGIEEEEDDIEEDDIDEEEGSKLEEGIGKGVGEVEGIVADEDGEEEDINASERHGFWDLSKECMRRCAF